ncbi:MAG: hypothetical protein ACJA1C_002241 [Crocinitomicaceae bacterium]|jgi:hypothetical protein
MSFNGTEGEFITLEEGADLTAAWRNTGHGTVKGYFYGKEKLQELLSGDSEGIRIYFGEGSEGIANLVLVGADAEENDLLDKILETGIPCPKNCSTNNPLNS